MLKDMYVNLLIISKFNQFLQAPPSLVSSPSERNRSLILYPHTTPADGPTGRQHHRKSYRPNRRHGIRCGKSTQSYSSSIHERDDFIRKILESVSRYVFGPCGTVYQSNLMKTYILQIPVRFAIVASWINLGCATTLAVFSFRAFLDAKRTAAKTHMLNPRAKVSVETIATSGLLKNTVEVPL